MRATINLAGLVGVRWAIALAMVFTLAAPSDAQVIGDPIRLTPVDHARKSEPFIAASGDEVVAVWYRRHFWTGSGWAYSADAGVTWTSESPFGGGPPDYQVTGQHPVVCADATGRFYAAVRSESSFGVGISTYRGEAGPTGFGWTGPVTVGPGGFSKDVDSPSIACDENGLVYVVYAEMEKVGDPLAGGHWVHSLRLHRSTDAAQTFEPVLSLAGPFIGDGRIAVGQDGAVIILWHDYSSGQVLGRRSVDQGLSFGPPFHVGAMLDNIGTEPAGWASNFARRNPYYFMLVGHAVPNAPSLAVDRTDGPQRGVIYAAWSEHAEGAPQPVSVMNELEPNELFVQAMSIVVGSEIVGSAIDPSKLTPGDFDRFYFEGTKGMVVQLEGELTDISPEPNFAFRSAARIECGEDSTRLQLLGH
jgi:hypothetical protein